MLFLIKTSKNSKSFIKDNSKHNHTKSLGTFRRSDIKLSTKNKHQKTKAKSLE
jgi:hypothetical protein